MSGQDGAGHDSHKPRDEPLQAEQDDSQPPAWAPFFQSMRMVDLPDRDASFAVYETRSEAPGPLYVFHHGAGHTAMTWALLARELAHSVHAGQSCSLLCFDARGHGKTKSASEDLPLSVLSDDLAALFHHLYPAPHEKDVILVGHSLGGSVVVDAMARSLIKGVRGVAVLDVVEGTAIDSLPHMKSILRNRPMSFPTPEAAVQWALRNHQAKNAEAARLSMPSQLVRSRMGQLTWRTDLARTSDHWQGKTRPGWFQDLSSKFLSARAGRLLILAGADRLDKPLTIGQMQGKFQMIIYPESGHTIQEDVPDKLAVALYEFWDRNKPLAVIKRFPIPAKQT
ncbi:Alpha/Beta hydrolase protein [Entophlyctis helioformis]|nr:Alpha/Beta hydrolase protein [Entophlyctis helioformis]